MLLMSILRLSIVASPLEICGLLAQHETLNLFDPDLKFRTNLRVHVANTFCDNLKTCFVNCDTKLLLGAAEYRLVLQT